jgi:hypothetical protein
VGGPAGSDRPCDVPNADVAALHNRMPVELNEDDAEAWVLEESSLEQVVHHYPSDIGGLGPDFARHLRER